MTTISLSRPPVSELVRHLPSGVPIQSPERTILLLRRGLSQASNLCGRHAGIDTFCWKRTATKRSHACHGGASLGFRAEETRAKFFKHIKMHISSLERALDFLASYETTAAWAMRRVMLKGKGTRQAHEEVMERSGLMSGFALKGLRTSPENLAYQAHIELG